MAKYEITQAAKPVTAAELMAAETFCGANSGAYKFKDGDVLEELLPAADGTLYFFEKWKSTDKSGAEISSGVNYGFLVRINRAGAKLEFFASRNDFLEKDRQYTRDWIPGGSVKVSCKGYPAELSLKEIKEKIEARKASGKSLIYRRSEVNYPQQYGPDRKISIGAFVEED